MHAMEHYDIIGAGEGRWDVQQQGGLSIVGYVWQTGAGFIAWDWADRQVGVFESLPRAVGALGAFAAAS